MFVIQGSARDGGNTEKLTELLLEGIDKETIRLREYHMEPFIDKRHDPNGFPQVEDDLSKLMLAMMEHDTIVFATPLYWYGMSSHMKLFIDYWTQYLRVESMQFKERMRGKKAYVVVVGGPKSKMTGLALIQQFRHIFDFMGMSFEGWIIGRGTRPDDILTDRQTIAEAKALNEELRRLYNN